MSRALSFHAACRPEQARGRVVDFRRGTSATSYQHRAIWKERGGVLFPRQCHLSRQGERARVWVVQFRRSSDSQFSIDERGVEASGNQDSAVDKSCRSVSGTRCHHFARGTEVAGCRIVNFGRGGRLRRVRRKAADDKYLSVREQRSGVSEATCGHAARRAERGGHWVVKFGSGRTRAKEG